MRLDVLRLKYEQNCSQVSLVDESPHDVASLLRWYLREVRIYIFNIHPV